MFINKGRLVLKILSLIITISLLSCSLSNSKTEEKLMESYNTIANQNRNNNISSIEILYESKSNIELLILFSDTCVLDTTHQIAVLTYFLYYDDYIKDKDFFVLNYGLDFEPEFRNTLSYSKEGFYDSVGKTYSNEVFLEMIGYIVNNFEKYDFIEYNSSFEFINIAYEKSVNINLYILFYKFSLLHNKSNFTVAEEKIIITMKGLYEFFAFAHEDSNSLRLAEQINDLWEIVMGSRLEYDLVNNTVLVK